jgi:hypothetical protein
MAEAICPLQGAVGAADREPIEPGGLVRLVTTHQIDFGSVGPARKRRFQWPIAFLPISILVVSSLTAACGSTTPFATAVPSTSPGVTASPPARRGLPAGYVTFVDTADHFSIAVPNAWRRIDLSTPGASQTLRDLVAANPGLRALLGSNAAALIAQGIKFYALNANDAAVPTVNVAARPAVGIRDSDPPRIAATLKAQYATIGATVSRISTSSVAGHTALQVAVTTRAVGPTGAAIAKDEIQDFVAANDFIYILTLAGTSPEFRTIAATLDVS